MYVHTPCMCLVPTEESKGSLELELLTVVSHCEGTGIKPESSTRARMPLFFFFLRFLISITHVCVWICTCQCRCLQRCQSPISCLIWILRLEHGSSGKASSTFNLRAISLAPSGIDDIYCFLVSRPGADWILFSKKHCLGVGLVLFAL